MRYGVKDLQSLKKKKRKEKSSSSFMIMWKRGGQFYKVKAKVLSTSVKKTAHGTSVKMK